MHQSAPDAARAFMEQALRDVPATRREHSLAVGRRMAELSVEGASPEERDLDVALGTLHDVGYGSPRTGHHAIDGGLMLLGTPFEHLAPYVAHHSTATAEAAERGLGIPFPEPERPLLDRLFVADFTTGPDGRRVTASERLREIRSRYGSDHLVVRALDASEARLLAALAASGIGLDD